MIRFLFLAFFLLTLACPARAERLHALAMHGTPLYPAGYAHFDYVNPAAPKGGALTTYKNGTFDNLNGNIILGNAAEGLELLNDKLMQRAWNEPFTLYGLVAESIEVVPDRSKITFHLNKAARFHDGAPMTAEDVKWTFEAYKAHGHPVRRRVYGLVSRVDVLSPHDIAFTFGPGHDRESVLILAMMPVLPKHYWEGRDISKTTLEPPLGSGPYRIASAEPGRKVVYERVTDYWAKDLPVNVGQHNFDRITYSYYRDDDIALQAFKAGDYNLRREYNIKKWMTAYDFRALKDGTVIKEELTHQRPEWLRALIFNTRRPAFADIRVRRALSLLFDFDSVNRAFFFGAFRRIDSLFPNSPLAARGVPEGEEKNILEAHRSVLPPEVLGPAWQPPAGDMRARMQQAVTLLKEAGWIYRDQKLVNAQTGAPFAFEILLGDPAEEKIALAFARGLKKAGIEARVRTVDSAQFSGRLEAFDYDMVSFRWINSLSPGNEQVNYWGSTAAVTKGSRNYAGISNAAVDALALGIAHAPTRESLVARVHALDRAILWGDYMIPLYYPGRDLVAHAANIMRPDRTPIYGIVSETWWAKPQP